MSDNIKINGYELVRVKKVTGDDEPKLDKANKSIMRNVHKSGVKLARWDANDMMTSEDGAVYALHGQRFITQAEIDKNYYGMK